MKKPIIGVIGRLQKNDRDQFFINDEIRISIICSGGMPVLLLPPYQDSLTSHIPFVYDMNLEDYKGFLSLLEFCDGFLFSGGEKWYGYEECIMEYAYQNDKPVLGICLGMQMMAFLPFFKEIKENPLTRITTGYTHYQENGFAHSIFLQQSLLKDIIKKDDILVTSRHHDCISLQPFFKVSATAVDNTIEAIEYPEKTFFLGVQWHPESSFIKDKNAQKIFKAFIEACQNN